MNSRVAFPKSRLKGDAKIGNTSVDLAWLPEHLTHLGYTAAALKQLLGVHSPDDVGLLNYAPAVQRIAAERSATAVLTRLFFLETAEPRRRVAALFAPAALAALVEA